MRQARPVAELIVEVRQPVIPDAGGQERAFAERPRVIDKHRLIATSDIGDTQAQSRRHGRHDGLELNALVMVLLERPSQRGVVSAPAS